MAAKYIEATVMGGTLWRGESLAGNDAGYGLIEKFIEQHPHES